MPHRADLAALVADVREQVLYLQELGVDDIQAGLLMNVAARAPRIEMVQTPVERPARSVPPANEPRPEYVRMPDIKVEIKKAPEPRPPGQSRLASLPSLSNRPITVSNKAAAVEKPTEMPPPARIETVTETHKEITIAPKPAETQTMSGETIEQIRAEIGPDCTRCKLSTLGRSRVVNSVGNFNADLMFVGEAPGADEDAQGEPFVGRAGQLLTDIIKAIGFDRPTVFIGNINRCRPPGNRAPEPDETVACKPFLFREIAVVRPRVIVVLGATAAQNLLETKVPIGKLRGQFHDYLGTKVMPTFHPAYLLRDPHKKREVWEDMKMVRDYLASI